MVFPTNQAPIRGAVAPAPDPLTSDGDLLALDPTLAVQLDTLVGHLQPIIARERCSYAQRCRELSLSTAHLHLMSLLEAHGPMSMTQVADLLDVALPNATGLVDRVRERGLVERRRDDADRRVVLVRLSDDGREVLRELGLVRRRRLALALQGMTSAQRTQLLESIHDLRVAFEAVAAKETDR
jgi:DNA-binding MarR family transcriptional regulator